MPKKLTIQEKALAVIEALVSDDLTQGLEFDCCIHPEKVGLISDADAKIISRKLTAVYCAAHSVNTKHSCFSVHDSWRKDVEKQYRKFKRAKEV